MPLPLILGAIALGTAAFGGTKAVEGISNMNEAEEIGKQAQKLYESTVCQLKVDWETTNKLAEQYGQLQIDVKIQTIGRFVTFMKRIDRQASRSDLKYLAGLEGISVQQIKEYNAAVIEAEEVSKGILTTAATSAAAGYSAVGLVGLFGTASTGTAIAGLSGAAAWNATLAWFGGGAIAAGGGGMALGAVVLGGVALGPALAVGGFMLAGKGEEALTKAREYEANVNIEIAKIEATKDFLQQVKRQIAELSSLVKNLNTRALLELSILESWFIARERKMSMFQKILKILIKTMPTFFGWLKQESQVFESEEELKKFQKVALLIKALVEIIKTPILDNEGQLNPLAATVKAKYRTLEGN